MSVKSTAQLLLPLLLIGAWPNFSSAYDVYIHVMGMLYGNTCTLSTDSKNININLGHNSQRQFLAIGAVSQIKTPFYIRLEECGPTFKGAKITFSGEVNNSDDRYLKTDGEASGLAISILDKNSKVIPLNTAITTYSLSGANRVDMLFYARLVATNLPVTPGNVTGIATYMVEYL